MKKMEDAEVKPSSMIDQAFLPIIDSAGNSASVASPAPASSVYRAASQYKEKDEEAFMDLSGFIFLCNKETKLDCFRFRVFGVGSNKKEMVEKIKPGIKLFLFDIEVRLLYGVYEATSTGGINLEAHSFGGKFPAQVRSLLSLFCPLTASTTAAVVSHPLAPCLANVGLPKIMPALAVEDQVKSLPYPQEVGSSMANVGPLNTNPAFAKEHQDEPKHQPRLSIAFVDEQNTGDDVDIDSFGNTQDESDRQDDISGFIFMCGRNTKHACYRFRVFGLPSNKQERIEKIKSRAKLFLFDFKVKLLYGVCEATSTGIINLEPLAFGGKFPAQEPTVVLPHYVPLVTQTTNLVYGGRGSLPLGYPSFYCYSRSWTGKYSSMPTSVENPYMTRMQHVHPPPIVESQRVYELQSAQHGWPRTTSFMESALTVAEPKQLTAPSHAYSHQPYVTQGISTDIRNPYHRYGSMQSGVLSQPHLMELNDRNYQLYSGVERGMLPPHESSATRNYFFGPSAPYAPPVPQQYASSEAAILEGTSSMSYQRSLIRRYG